MTGVVEVVHIDISAERFGRVIVDGEPRAHEEASVVEPHLEVLAYRLPVVAVGAVGELRNVSARVEIGHDLEIDDIAVQTDTLHLAVLDPGDSVVVTVEGDGGG